MCYLDITNGGGCSRVTCLLGKGRERKTTIYLHSEEYKAGFRVKSLLCWKTKILDFLRQPGNSHGWARLTDTHLQPSTQLGRNFHPLLHSDVPTADRSGGYPPARLSAFHCSARLMQLSVCAASSKHPGLETAKQEDTALQRSGKAKPEACFGWARALFLKTHLLLLHCLRWGLPCYGGHFFLYLTQRAPWFWSSLFFVAVFQVLSAIHKVRRVREHLMEQNHFRRIFLKNHKCKHLLKTCNSYSPHQYICQ